MSIKRKVAAFGAAILTAGAATLGAAQPALANGGTVPPAPSPEIASALPPAPALPPVPELPNLSSSVVPACADKMMFSLAASDTSHPLVPNVLDPIGLVKFSNDLRARGVSVTAVPYDALWSLGQISYYESRDDGIRRTEDAMRDAAARCPNAKIGLIGYSEGADITAKIAHSIGAGQGPIPSERLGAVISIGNPSRSPNAHVVGTSGPGEGFFPATDYGVVADKVYEYCDYWDGICNTTNVAPGTREVLVAELAGRRFFTPEGFQDSINALGPRLATPEGQQALASLPVGLLAVAYHASSYWLLPDSLLNSDAIDFVLAT